MVRYFARKFVLVQQKTKKKKESNKKRRRLYCQLLRSSSLRIRGALNIHSFTAGRLSSSSMVCGCRLCMQLTGMMMTKTKMKCSDASAFVYAHETHSEETKAYLSPRLWVSVSVPVSVSVTVTASAPAPASASASLCVQSSIHRREGERDGERRIHTFICTYTHTYIHNTYTYIRIHISVCILFVVYIVLYSTIVYWYCIPLSISLFWIIYIVYWYCITLSLDTYTHISLCIMFVLYSALVLYTSPSSTYIHLFVFCLYCVLYCIPLSFSTGCFDVSYTPQGMLSIICLRHKTHC